MIFATFTALLSALNPSAPIDGKIVAASLFKNGYAVVVREAELKDGEASIRPPANTVLGTLWISSSKGVTLTRASTETIVTEGQRDATTLDEILTANFEKTITVETSQGNGSQAVLVKGRVISSAGTMLVLEGETDRVALYKSSILRVVAAEHGLGFRVPTSTSERVLKIKGEGSGKVYVVSLQRGMTWAPAFQVDLVDDKNLTLTAKATILNDLAPIEDISVNLVTGFPNIRFIDVLDPLTSGYSVDQYVQGVAMATTENEFKRDALTQNALGGGFGRGDAPAVSMPPAGSGSQLEDLFFYKQPHVSLKTGERGYVILFSIKSAYEHIYTVDVPDTAIQGNPTDRFGAQADAPLDVWHTLKFKNTAGQPLTTGPATTIKNGEVIGQDVVNYTSVGADTKVRVTKSLDIRADALDEEIGRERGFIKYPNSSSFDRVTLKGTIELTNRKDSAVQMLVTKMASGEVTEAGGATVTKRPAGLRQLNPMSQLVWKPLLKSGETVRLTYTIQVLVPSN